MEERSRDVQQNQKSFFSKMLMQKTVISMKAPQSKAVLDELSKHKRVSTGELVENSQDKEMYEVIHEMVNANIVRYDKGYIKWHGKIQEDMFKCAEPQEIGRKTGTYSTS